MGWKKDKPLSAAEQAYDEAVEPIIKGAQKAYRMEQDAKAELRAMGADLDEDDD